MHEPDRSVLSAVDDVTECLSRIPIDATFRTRGFLPKEDPLTGFSSNSRFAVLDEIGRDLPSLLHDRKFRGYARTLKIPPWPEDRTRSQDIPGLRLYYVRVGLLASAYVNPVGDEPATILPANLAVPLCRACKLLKRPPILSYDGYALYNWKRFRKDAPIALGNIDTIQNFVHLYDEHWFILVHIEIEALAASILGAIRDAEIALDSGSRAGLNASVASLARTLWAQVETLRRIPEKMDPALYYKTFRPYIRFFEGVVYEGVEASPLNFRGETGAQSSVVPTVLAFLKVPHRSSMLTDHL